MPTSCPLSVESPPSCLLDAEVGQVRVAVLVEQHVAGLDVPVHEPAAVGGVERVGDLGEQGEGALRAEPALALEQRAQVAALHVAHGDIELPVVLAGLVDGDDARVLQGGGEPGLLQEAAPEPLVLGELRRDQLQRDGALEAEVGRPVHHAHPAPAEERLHAIARERRAGDEYEAHGATSSRRYHHSAASTARGGVRSDGAWRRQTDPDFF